MVYMSEISDRVHRELMSKYVEYCEKYNLGELHVEIEKPYNHYGQRGFIDIFSVNRNAGSYNVCEVKPSLENLGEAIRQLKKVESALESGMTLDYDIAGLRGFYRLVTLFNEHNYSIISDSYVLLKNVKIPLGISLFCEKNNYWFGPLWPNYFKPESISEHWDQLDWRWERCQKGLTEHKQ